MAYTETVSDWDLNPAKTQFGSQTYMAGTQTQPQLMVLKLRSQI